MLSGRSGQSVEFIAVDIDKGRVWSVVPGQVSYLYLDPLHRLTAAPIMTGPRLTPRTMIVSGVGLKISILPRLDEQRFKSGI